MHGSARQVLPPVLDEADVREDFDPDEVRRALIKIIRRVAVRGRLTGWSGRAREAGDLFDHIHNLPQLVESPNALDLMWFWNNYAWHFDMPPPNDDWSGYRSLFDAIATPRALARVRDEAPDDAQRRRVLDARRRYASALQRGRGWLIFMGIVSSIVLPYPLRSAFASVVRAAPSHALYMVAWFVVLTLGLFSLALALGAIAAWLEPSDAP